jgi:hypothetical protein
LRLEESHSQRFVIVMEMTSLPDMERTDSISSNMIRLIANLETTEMADRQNFSKGARSHVCDKDCLCKRARY